jgi:hypothetical protein
MPMCPGRDYREEDSAAKLEKGFQLAITLQRLVVHQVCGDRVLLTAPAHDVRLLAGEDRNREE